MSVKFVCGIGSAPPPPRALAAPTKHKVAKTTAAPVFNIFLSSLPPRGEWSGERSKADM
jgi:hypothetical protein